MRAPFTLTKDTVRPLLPGRSDGSHKGTYGRALLIAGSDRYAGAAVMSAAACLRCGAGITYAAVPDAVRPAFYALPEAICIACGKTGIWDTGAVADAEKEIPAMDAVALGPGMGEIASEELIEKVLTEGKPTVLDADALNHIAKHRELLSLLHPKVVLTPHPGEMARLTGRSMESILSDPAFTAEESAKEWNCTVLLKGAKSFIAFSDELYCNSTGNASLAKGGSGDVLTGMILAFLAQGMRPADAACAGSYLLGATADEALDLLEKRVLLSRDIVSLCRETAEGLKC